MCVCRCMYLCMYIFTYIYIYIYVCVYIYAHTHTDTYLYVDRAITSIPRPTDSEAMRPFSKRKVISQYTIKITVPIVNSYRRY